MTMPPYLSSRNRVHGGSASESASSCLKHRTDWSQAEFANFPARSNSGRGCSLRYRYGGSRKMTSARSSSPCMGVESESPPPPTPPPPALNTSPVNTRVLCPTRSASMFFFRRATAGGCRSKNTARAAPRLRHSNPIDPVPEKTSKTTDPSNRGESTSNSDCLARSVMGRVASSAGARSVRPRCSPAMIRMSRPFILPADACRCHGLMPAKLQCGLPLLGAGRSIGYVSCP